MKERQSACEMILVFDVPDHVTEAAPLIFALDAAGFGDALVGAGFANRLGLQLVRSGDDAEKVVADTTRAVLAALPPGTMLCRATVSEGSFDDLPAHRKIQIMQLGHWAEHEESPLLRFLTGLNRKLRQEETRPFAMQMLDWVVDTTDAHSGIETPPVAQDDARKGEDEKVSWLVFATSVASHGRRAA